MIKKSDIAGGLVTGAVFFGLFFYMLSEWLVEPPVEQTAPEVNLASYDNYVAGIDRAQLATLKLPEVDLHDMDCYVAGIDQSQVLTLERCENAADDTEDAAQTQQESLGTFVITYYCPCEACCGKCDGITTTGTHATEGRTIAVDPDVIALGSTVIIDGHSYIAEDTGAAVNGKHIDIYCDSHTEAVQMGIHTETIYRG